MPLDLKKLCRERIVVYDGAMGTSIQALELSIDDFQGNEGCNEILNISRPQAIQKIHADFLKAGCQIIETNTFGANRIVLGEYNLAEKDYDLNFSAAQLARQVADDFSSAENPRYVAGCLGPGSKLPSLGHIHFTALRDAYQRQVEGLIDGGVDLLVIETSQDLLQMKAVLVAVAAAQQNRGRHLPVQAQVTMETTGTMLLGSDMLTAIVTLAPFPIDVLGLNCATGPKTMVGHIRTLSQRWERLISVIPNAGLPRMEADKIIYDLAPAEFAGELKYFVTELGANIVGGCCGTTPDHIQALSKAVGGLTPKKRTVEWIPAASGLYNISGFSTDPKPLIIGERCNANGSKKFRQFLLNNDLDGMVSIAHQQEKEQAHLLDICTAYVGEDEEKSLSTLAGKLNTDSQLPLMLDSTQPKVLECALQRIGGKAVINSVNLEDGGTRLREILGLCKKYGAAVVALTIDENGMAKTAEQKLEIVRRLYKIITREFQLPPHDIFIDTLTFTIGSGEGELRTAALETMQAIRMIKAEFPEVYTILGVSNISFGLKPAIRHRLNSVFLAHAIEAGLDAAILHAGKIIPLYKLQAEERELCENLIFNRRTETRDPLIELLNFYKDKKIKDQPVRMLASLPLKERLKQRIIDGDRMGMAEDLEECRQTESALEIINNILLAGMKMVGELFGSGEMQLPFVLKSAETMKIAVSHLEPYLDKKSGKAKGKVVLATVRGDVHDIGKNLVDIILSNNGYKVLNLGIKQPIEAILQAWRETEADVIGMSGLLVKSTLVMKENLAVMNQLGVRAPVLLGGAALTRNYVETDLQGLYQGNVWYAKDAFEGLNLLEGVLSGDLKPKEKSPVKSSETKPTITGEEEEGLAEIRLVSPPKPLFWGRQVVTNIPLADIVPFVDRPPLYRGQWRMKRNSKNREQYAELVRDVLEPKFDSLLAKAEYRQLLNPAFIYGYFACTAEGDRLHVFAEPDDKAPLFSFSFPRQKQAPGLCVADFFQSIHSGKRDILPLQIATMGAGATTESQRLYAEDQYQEYLYWHGFTVAMAEALAEYAHQKIRRELGIHHQDAREHRELIRGNYQGIRLSFGYSAGPDLEEQRKMFQLLKPAEIGITLTETFQLVPEQTTSAFVLHHPAARYFNC